MPKAPIPLKDCLMLLTKRDMGIAAELLGERIPTIWPKAHMAERLTAIYRDHKADMHNALSDVAVEISLSLLDQFPNGVCPLTSLPEYPPLLFSIYLDHMSYYALIDFRDECLLFCDYAIAVVRWRRKAKRADVARHDLMERCALALIQMYGAVEENELVRALKRLFDDVTAAHLTRFVQMRTGLSLHSNRILREGPKMIWRCQPQMSDLSALLDHRREQPDLPYRSFTIPHLYQVINEDYTCFSNGYAALKAMMTAQGFPLTAIRERLEALFFILQQDDARYRIEQLADSLFQDGACHREADEAMIDYFETIPRWSLKGHSLRELSEPIARPRAKVIPLDFDADAPPSAQRS